MEPHLHTARRMAVGLTAVLVLAGCSLSAPRTGPPPEPASPSAPSAASPTPSPSPPVASPVWENEVDLIGEPVVLDDIIVAYVKTPHTMVLAAFDPQTGEQIWRQAVSAGGDSWVGLERPAVIAHSGRIWVAAASATGANRHRVILIDALTGTEQPIAGPSLWVSELPHPCPTDGRLFCLRGYLPDADKATAFVIDPGVPTLASTSETGRSFLGHHVFTRDAGPRGATLLGYLDDGSVAWEQEYSSVFGAGTSPAYDAIWHDAGSAPIIVGQGGLPMPEDPQVGDRSTAQRTSTVGLDRATGARRWTVAGAESCFEELDPEPSPDVFIACRRTAGEIVITERSGNRFSYKLDGLVEQLIGIDRVTGKILWALPFPPRSEASPRWFMATRTRAVIPVAGLGVQVVDLRTGETTAVPPDAELACRTHRDMVTLDRGDDRSAEFVTGDGLVPCDPAGKELPAWSPESLAWIGQRVGELYIVAGKKTLAAYRIS